MKASTVRTLQDQGWVTIGQAAAFYGVHRTTIYRWMMAGEVDWCPTPGGQKRVKVSVEDEDLAARTRKRLA